MGKTSSSKKILEPLGHEVDNIKMDTPEIQADRVEDVAAYSAKWASEQLKCSVVKNVIIDINQNIVKYYGLCIMELLDT